MITLKVTYTDGRGPINEQFEDATDARNLMEDLLFIERVNAGSTDNMTVIVSTVPRNTYRVKTDVKLGTDTIHGITHMTAQIQES